jgi:Zn finger protein HypA/HybF involved in hydrogenase expression
MFGIRKDKKRMSLPWRGVKTGLALVAVSSFVFGYMNTNEEVAKLPIKDPVIKMRCTSCDAPDHRKRVEWETEAFEKADIPDNPAEEVVFAPEEVPIKCNRCNEEALYIEARTSPCTQCGHFAPNFEATFFSKLHRHDGCRHCIGKDAEDI